MSLVEPKKKILKILSEAGTPLKAKDVAQKAGLGVAAATMHLLGLKKSGHVSNPQHGLYALTDFGRETLSSARMDKTMASKILNRVPSEKAFHFYTGMHQYTHTVAHSLSEFVERLQKIDPKSVEFHVPRKDFEQWAESLGDYELAKRLASIRNMHVHGEDLRTRIYETVKHRVEELKRFIG